MSEKIKKNKIKITSISENDANIDTSRIKIKCKCNFCEREVTLYKSSKDEYNKISRGNKFHCASCIRNKYHTNIKKNVLILTFRSLIGHYYHAFYRGKKTLTYTELVEYIDLHKSIGLQNPLFNYDPESLCWFVNFDTIGKNHYKMPLGSVLKTVMEILACLDFNRFFGDDFQSDKIYEKYKQAIDEFYSQRKRPEGKKILAPTFSKCGFNVDIPIEVSRVFNFEVARNFTKKDLMLYNI